jgi:uncharacterized protein DUF6851
MTMRQNTLTRSKFLILVVLILCACTAEGQTTSGVVIVWNNALLQSIRDTKPGPPMVARDIAIVHTAMFDAWAAYDARADGTQLGGTLRRPDGERTLENKQKAISFAAYRTLLNLFPT